MRARTSEGERDAYLCERDEYLWDMRVCMYVMCSSSLLLLLLLLLLCVCVYVY